MRRPFIIETLERRNSFGRLVHDIDPHLYFWMVVIVGLFIARVW